jgi:hemoglobin-like flavoprotein
MGGMDADLITHTFELAAERCADPTALVYRRLFEREPAMEALFVRDTDASVRGQMLYQVIETMLDFVGRRHFAVGMIRSEVVNHENLGVPPQVFASFFATVMESFRELLDRDWTPAMDAAWAELLAGLQAEAAPHPG